jgi:hypothetical protein
MNHPARSEFDNEESVQLAEQQVGYSQEVAGPDIRSMDMQKRSPGLARGAR